MIFNILRKIAKLMYLLFVSKSNMLKDFLFAYFLLALFLFICFLISPNVILNNEGTSAFGINLLTVVPYATGYFLFAYFIGRSVKYIKHDFQPFNIIYYAFNLMAIFFIALVFTPYSIGTGFDWIHTTISTLLFLTELGLSVYLVFKIRLNFINILAFIGEVISGIIAMFSIDPPPAFFSGFNLLLQGEVMFQIFFILIIIETISKISISYTKT
jgi:hypothetical protein